MEESEISFEDLGLEYNVDYLDASKKASGRRVKDDYQKGERLMKKLSLLKIYMIEL